MGKGLVLMHPKIAKQSDSGGTALFAMGGTGGWPHRTIFSNERSTSTNITCRPTLAECLGTKPLNVQLLFTARLNVKYYTSRFTLHPLSDFVLFFVFLISKGFGNNCLNFIRLDVLVSN